MIKRLNVVIILYKMSNIILEYVWIGGYGERRSKTRILVDVVINNIDDINDIPIWNCDGSSTCQADANGNTEVILIPRKIFNNPLIANTSYIVLCETYDINFKPLPSNNRHSAIDIFNRGIKEYPWFGMEQEYDMIYKNSENLSSEGRYYCGTQLNRIERKIAEEHMFACLKANIKYCGLNSEVSKNQWEFQVGPCENIEAGDHLTIANFLLERIAEQYDVKISYIPKLYSDKNGTGCHTNFSTLKTRSENGIEEIYKCIQKLEDKHKEHIEVYGEDNNLRLTGLHETSSYNNFSFGVGTRNTSVRIPTQVAKDGRGYFEDRRPAANIDPYQVTSIIFKTCCLED
jgi:glutamine synthetase